MTTGGWIIMLLSVGGTTGFFVWCIARVLGPPDRTGKVRGVLDTASSALVSYDTEMSFSRESED